MTDPETINRRLHEIIGLCWHEWPKWEFLHCRNCGKEIQGGSITDFFTWQGFGILWEWLQGHERLGDFISRYNQHLYGSNYECVDYKLVSPPALAKAVVEFFEEEER